MVDINKHKLLFSVCSMSMAAGNSDSFDIYCGVPSASEDSQNKVITIEGLRSSAQR